MSALVSTAFAAGLVATVNPCGFAMLPAYLGFFLGTSDSRTRVRTPLVAGSVAAGFLVVFAVSGGLISAGLQSVVDAIPWLALAVGAGLVVIGVAQLAGRRLLPSVPGPARARKRGSVGGMFVFGMSYAIASLSCTLPIFLSLIAGVATTGDVWSSFAAFMAYGAGMATAVTGLTFAVAGGRNTVVARLRSFTKYLDIVSGVVMTIAGGFIVWYWATVLSGSGIELGSIDLVRWIDRTSASATGFLGRNAWWVAAVTLTIVGGMMLRSKNIAEPTDQDSSETVPSRKVDSTVERSGEWDSG